jgi:hypothetical protein
MSQKDRKVMCFSFLCLLWESVQQQGKKRDSKRETATRQWQEAMKKQRLWETQLTPRRQCHWHSTHSSVEQNVRRKLTQFHSTQDSGCSAVIVYTLKGQDIYQEGTVVEWIAIFEMKKGRMKRDGQLSSHRRLSPMTGNPSHVWDKWCFSRRSRRIFSLFFRVFSFEEER